MSTILALFITFTTFSSVTPATKTVTGSTIVDDYSTTDQTNSIIQTDYDGG